MDFFWFFSLYRHWKNLEHFWFFYRVIAEMKNVNGLLPEIINPIARHGRKVQSSEIEM